MTPLAHRLAHALLRPDGGITAEFQAVTAAALSGAHFFEVTDAVSMGEEIATITNKTWDDGETFIPCTFLPAPSTWLEWRQRETSLRRAVSLRQIGNRASVEVFFTRANGRIETIKVGTIDLKTGQGFIYTKLLRDYPEADDWLRGIFGQTTVFLAIVNSPNIVGRRTHPPRKTVARKLSRSTGANIGPLHDWHEIKLEVNKPHDADDGEAHADVLTGKRALHFVRKFIRIRFGKLEYVRAHWRGDASVGIRRGRYVVTA